MSLDDDLTADVAAMIGYDGQTWTSLGAWQDATATLGFKAETRDTAGQLASALVALSGSDRVGGSTFPNVLIDNYPLAPTGPQVVVSMAATLAPIVRSLGNEDLAAVLDAVVADGAQLKDPTA